MNKDTKGDLQRTEYNIVIVQLCFKLKLKKKFQQPMYVCWNFRISRIFCCLLELAGYSGEGMKFLTGFFAKSSDMLFKAQCLIKLCNIFSFNFKLSSRP